MHGKAGACACCAHRSMALRTSWTRVRMAEPKAQVPKDGPRASPTERLVLPTMEAPGGEKYHCAIVADSTYLRISPCTRAMLAGVRAVQVRQTHACNMGFVQALILKHAAGWSDASMIAALHALFLLLQSHAMRLHAAKGKAEAVGGRTDRKTVHMVLTMLSEA